MKKIFFLIFPMIFLLVSCQGQVGAPTANSIGKEVKEKSPMLMECVEQMEAFSLERCYVAMEVFKEEENAEEEDGEPVLVFYEKESDERKKIENPILQKGLEEMGLTLIFYQTSSDARRCVIFSFSKENDDGLQKGFYYSFDSLPCAWWGRKGELSRKDKRYVQANQKADAWYYTVEIGEGFFYFEKKGNLTA